MQEKDTCGLNQNGPCPFYVRIFCAQLAELFKRNQDVWSCWRKCILFGEGVSLEVDFVVTKA